MGDKLYSKSIFTLGTFIASQQTLLPLDPTTFTPQFDVTPLPPPPSSTPTPPTSSPTHTTSTAPSEPPTTRSGGEIKLYCNTCTIGFEDVKEQHTHYKSEWHSFNLKLKLAGASSISKEEFEALGDVSSSSESDSDSEDNSGEHEDKASDKLQQFLKKETQEDEASSTDKTKVAKSHKLAFVAQQGGNPVVISLWRCVCEEQKRALETGDPLVPLKAAIQNQKWVILLVSGGRFAGAVFSGNNCVVHKAMHRYTVRKKQGGSQSTKDSTGNAPKSAGASLRRYNETRLREDIAEILQNWKEHISTCQYIFYFAPKGAPLSMLTFEGSPLQQRDPKLRKIPLPIRRPTYPTNIYFSI